MNVSNGTDNHDSSNSSDDNIIITTTTTNIVTDTNSNAHTDNKPLTSSPPSTPPSTEIIDAHPLEEQLTSSSPDRRTDIDEQPIIIAQESLPTVLAMVESLGPRRVKVYELRGEVWVDLGTGFCQGFVENVLFLILFSDHLLICLQSVAYLRVISEETPTIELLNCSIMERTEYVKQQGIAWFLFF